MTMDGIKATASMAKKLVGTLPVRWRVILSMALIGLIVGVWKDHRPIVVEGLPRLRRPVSVVTVDADEINQRLTEAQLRGLTALARCRRLSLRQLRLVKEIEPALVLERTGLIDKLKSTLGAKASVAAFYAVGRDTLFVLDPHGLGVEHETVHAYDDQTSGRMHATVTTDEALAIRAAVEGTAVDIVHGPVMDFSVDGSLDENGWTLAYALGPGYVARHAGRAEDMVKLWPKTTAEVLFDAPGAQAVAEDSTGTVCTDRVGALGILTLGVQGGLDYTRAVLLARAWRGDRVDTRLRGVERELTWTIVVGDSGAAKEIEQIIQSRGLTAPRTIVHAVVKDLAHKTNSTLDSLARIQERLR